MFVFSLPMGFNIIIEEWYVVYINQIDPSDSFWNEISRTPQTYP